ncbi:dihydroorotate dehydrogenase electron transfer subunit [Fundidesulfovibrio butyratiphilus]
MPAPATCQDVRVLSAKPHSAEEEGRGLLRIELENPGWTVVPGQFAMLRSPRFGQDLLWGRPFSISRATPDTLTFCVQVAGRGTARLAELTPGETVTLWGPLGQGFALEPDTPTLLVAGGVGLAPFVQYALIHPRPENLALFFGHRVALGCYPFAEIAGVCRAESFQDQGPRDIPRLIARLEALVADHAGGLVLACGPTPLLRAVKDLAAKSGARAQVSLENRMACGVGACLGCVAKDAEGHHVQTCTHGPVFWADHITL